MCKRNVLIAAVLLTAVFVKGKDLSSPIPAEANPIIEQFADDITFYADFDANSGIPIMSAGAVKPLRSGKKVTFTKGVFGRALRTGNFYYPAANVLDLTRSGTLIAWIAPLDWKSEIDKRSFLFFHGHTDKWHLLVGRQAGIATPYAYYQRGSKSASLRSGEKANSKTWKPDKWHMITVSWRPDALCLSVDGERFARKNLAMSICRKTNGFTIGSLYGFPVLLDEFVIINRKISDAEVKAAYEAVMTVLSKGAPKNK